MHPPGVPSPAAVAGCVHELQYQMPPGGQAEEGTETAEAPPLPGVLSAAAPCPRLQHLGIHELQVMSHAVTSSSCSCAWLRHPM